MGGANLMQRFDLSKKVGPLTMLQTHLALAIAWIIYCVLHSFLAADQIKRSAEKVLRNQFRLYRLYYTIFSFIGLTGLLIYQFLIPSAFLFFPPLFLKILGVLIMVIGGCIMLLMIRKYFMQLSGVRWLYHEQVKSKLEVKGLHRFVRHPLYLGTFAFIWGWFLLSPLASFFIAAIIITIYTLIGLRFEEHKLIKEFGDDYLEYQKKVPKLIPKL
jgi:protein-S-isoprenylcysteine O-methyltransferase Ste14